MFEKIGNKKLKELILSIEKRINSIENPQIIKKILTDTQELISYGEWFIGFEIMIENLYEYNYKISNSELNLIKEIFNSVNINWKKDWECIENMV